MLDTVVWHYIDEWTYECNFYECAAFFTHYSYESAIFSVKKSSKKKTFRETILTLLYDKDVAFNFFAKIPSNWRFIKELYLSSNNWFDGKTFVMWKNKKSKFTATQFFSSNQSTN